MPKHILFVQGAGEEVHDAWDEKLVCSLKRELGDGYAVRYPRMPDEADPQYAAWKGVLLDELGKIAGDTILVGHSYGGAVLVGLLAEHPQLRNIEAVVLMAAPFIGEGGWPSDETVPDPDLAELLPSAIVVHLYHGTADNSVPFEHMKLYAKAVPHAVVHPLRGRDHQLNNDLREVARLIRSLVEN